jgi:Family of unknown function (DUF5985)
MFLFVSGMLMMGFFVLAMFFWCFWLRTRDWFFMLFAVAWMLLGAERLALAVVNAPEEPRAGMYFIRLAAFLLIAGAILYKNRVRSR